MFDFSGPLGTAVKQARNQCGYTQNEVAEMIGVDCRTILNIENFKGNPKMEVLYPLVRALHINPNNIFYPEIEQDDTINAKLMMLLGSCNEQELETLMSVCESILNVIRSQNATQIK